MNLDALLQAALDEDLGPGDLATESTIDPTAAGRAAIRAREALVVSGHRPARRALELAAARYDGDVAYEVRIPDGARAEAGDVVARVSGSLRGILVGERLALNLMMRLSGVATWTARYAAAAGGVALRVVDTRKTTPLWRALEKEAVVHGGGHNHRMGLFDGCLLKDNHVDAVGGVAEAVRRARARIHHLVRIQVECRTVAEVREALGAGADAVLLDNMDDATLAEAVAAARAASPGAVIEASGGITPERIAAIRDLGLDVVSAGGLVHQARWVDLSMKIEA